MKIEFWKKNSIFRKALYLLQEVVTPGVNAGDLVGEKTQQHCLEVKEGVAVLLELGHTREASDLLMQLAGVCRSIGVLVEGNDHKEFILYVSNVLNIKHSIE